jgi:hypothetical protein
MIWRTVLACVGAPCFVLDVHMWLSILECGYVTHMSFDTAVSNIIVNYYINTARLGHCVLTQHPPSIPRQVMTTCILLGVCHIRRMRVHHKSLALAASQRAGEYRGGAGQGGGGYRQLGGGGGGYDAESKGAAGGVPGSMTDTLLDESGDVEGQRDPSGSSAGTRQLSGSSAPAASQGYIRGVFSSAYSSIFG